MKQFNWEGGGEDGVEILDISDPANPTHVGAITDDATTRLDGATGIFVSGKFAYVASQDDNGMEVLDLSGIDAPAASIGSLSTNNAEVTDNARIGNDLMVRGNQIRRPGIHQ